MTKYRPEKYRTILLKTKIEGAYEPVELNIYNDGAIALSNENGEQFIYLYKDQKEKLKKILNKEKD